MARLCDSPYSSFIGNKQPIRVLVVDDSPSVVDRLSRILSEIPGIEFTGWANDKAAALAAIQQHVPDVVLVDFQLGEEDGLDIVKAFRQKLPRMMFIVFSNFPEIEPASRQAGAEYFFDKSNGAIALIDLLERMGTGDERDG